MAERLTCRLCETRKPKRLCPGIVGDICPQCCGREREETIRCPLDCVYLVEGRKHDHGVFDPYDFPHKEIRVDDEYIEENHQLFTVLSLTLMKAAHETPGVVDSDLRDCLEAAIQTYLTLDTVLIYETEPANMVAAAVQARLMDSIVEFKNFAYEKTGVHSIKDGDLLRVLVFLQRLALTTNNGRRYGRAFLSAIREAFEVQAPDAPVPVADASPPSLII